MWEVKTKYTVGDARPNWVRGMMPCQHLPFKALFSFLSKMYEHISLHYKYFPGLGTGHHSHDTNASSAASATTKISRPLPQNLLRLRYYRIELIELETLNTL